MGEKITIPADTTVNDGDHEDGDGFVLNQSLEAHVIEVVKESGSVKVIIPAIDKDRVFFVHQPVKKT